MILESVRIFSLLTVYIYRYCFMKRGQWNPNREECSNTRTQIINKKNAFTYVSSFSSDRPYRWWILLSTMHRCEFTSTISSRLDGECMIYSMLIDDEEQRTVMNDIFQSYNDRIAQQTNDRFLYYIAFNGFQGRAVSTRSGTLRLYILTIYKYTYIYTYIYIHIYIE